MRKRRIITITVQKMANVEYFVFTEEKDRIYRNLACKGRGIIMIFRGKSRD